MVSIWNDTQIREAFYIFLKKITSVKLAVLKGLK